MKAQHVCCASFNCGWNSSTHTLEDRHQFLFICLSSLFSFYFLCPFHLDRFHCPFLPVSIPSLLIVSSYSPVSPSLSFTRSVFIFFTGCKCCSRGCQAVTTETLCIIDGVGSLRPTKKHPNCPSRAQQAALLSNERESIRQAEGKKRQIFTLYISEALDVTKTSLSCVWIHTYKQQRACLVDILKS